MGDTFGFSEFDAQRLLRMLREWERTYKYQTPPKGRHWPIGGSSTTTSTSGADWNYFRQVGTSPFERWYTVPCTAVATTTLNVAAQTFYLTPFPAPRGGTLDNLGLWVNNTNTNRDWTVNLAVYDTVSDTNLYPDALLTSTGAISCPRSTTTVAKGAISLALTAGKLYYLAAVFAGTLGDGAVSAGAVSTNYVISLFGVQNDLVSGYCEQGFYNAAGTATYPNPFTAGLSPNYHVFEKLLAPRARFSA